MAYFSRAGENYHYGGRIDLEKGNTHVVADMIRELIRADVYEITAAETYPDDYEETVERNKREQDSDARPGIAGSLPDLGRYDAILLGSGVWGSQAPMIMRTFVNAFDWTGKTAHPFVTYAVSGMSGVDADYAQWCDGATVGDGLAVQGEEAAGAEPQVEDWLRPSGLLG